MLKWMNAATVSVAQILKFLVLAQTQAINL